MPYLVDETHQKIDDKAIKNNALSVDFKTFVINGKRHISHHEIARIFDLNPAVVAGLLDDFQWEDGQGDTVYFCNRTFWADHHAFYALAASLDLGEALMQAVLMALGHFRQRCPHLPEGGVAPLDCELVVCQCCAEQ